MKQPRFFTAIGGNYVAYVYTTLLLAHIKLSAWKTKKDGRIIEGIVIATRHVTAFVDFLNKKG